MSQRVTRSTCWPKSDATHKLAHQRPSPCIIGRRRFPACTLLQPRALPSEWPSMAASGRAALMAARLYKATTRWSPRAVRRGSRSGARHEIDGVGQGPEIGAWIESKARTTLDKSDVAVFHVKCFDLHREAASEYPEQTAKAKWWPLLVSWEPTDEAVRRMCCDLGVVVCDPRRLPLPALLFAASRPNADDYLSETHLGELVRLAEPACAPMQQRWRLDIDRRVVSLCLDNMDSTEIADLLFLQDEMTQDPYHILLSE